MIVGVPSETARNESRVALIPPVANRLVERGLDVCVAAGAGREADWADDAFREAGCSIVEDRSSVFDRADVIVQVRGLGANPHGPADPYRVGQTVIGLLGPHAIEDEVLESIADRRVSAFALELIPRIGRAQSMDVLTSMASIGGYKAAIIAAERLPALFPMQMTAAGTVQPAKVFVVGAGVAGLQAIATARRLGARVRAYDLRPAVKEEVRSLGAEFVEFGLESDEPSDEEGYAREQDESFYREQREMMARVIGESDVVITSAAVPGRPAPTLMTSGHVEAMDAGSVIVDLAAESGGNCELTRPGNTIEHAGVTVVGPTNLPSTVGHTASQLFANNVHAFLTNLLDDGGINIDTSDEIVDSTLLTHDGAKRKPLSEAELMGNDIDNRSDR